MPSWKKKGSVELPQYVPSTEENEAYLWCVRNGYIVSPMGTKTNGEWVIGIASTRSYKEVRKSPKAYGVDEIMQKHYEICLWLMNKHKN